MGELGPDSMSLAEATTSTSGASVSPLRGRLPGAAGTGEVDPRDPLFAARRVLRQRPATDFPGWLESREAPVSRRFTDNPEVTVSLGEQSTEDWIHLDLGGGMRLRSGWVFSNAAIATLS